MQKHQIESALREMYVQNNFSINDYDSKMADIQARSIFDKNVSPAESVLLQKPNT
jgi:hypothetical protein